MKLKINQKKFLTESIYTLVKQPVKPFISAIFNPIVINRDCIPKDGKVVYAPNHRKTEDSFLMFTVIKDAVHWMALKRFFTGEDSIFHNNKNPFLCKITSLVFYGIGAVPIIREQDKEKYPAHDNSESLKEFDNYLKLGGSIGIFPEGTTNKSPEDQNFTLPIRTSAFRFVKNNDAWLQPISIVWIPSSLKIKNKAVINFRPPFKSGDMDFPELLEKWQETVNEGIEENKQIIENLKNIREIVGQDQKVKKIGIRTIR